MRHRDPPRSEAALHSRELIRSTSTLSETVDCDKSRNDRNMHSLAVPTRGARCPRIRVGINNTHRVPMHQRLPASSTRRSKDLRGMSTMRFCEDLYYTIHRKMCGSTETYRTVVRHLRHGYTLSIFSILSKSSCRLLLSSTDKLACRGKEVMSFLSSSKS